jgi:hypothetical protein
LVGAGGTIVNLWDDGGTMATVSGVDPSWLALRGTSAFDVRVTGGVTDLSQNRNAAAALGVNEGWNLSSTFGPGVPWPGMWAFSPTDYWGVNYRGYVRQLAGSDWANSSSLLILEPDGGANTSLNDVWGYTTDGGTRELIAVGSTGFACQWDESGGTTYLGNLVQWPLSSSLPLYRVWGSTSQGIVLAVGAGQIATAPLGSSNWTFQSGFPSLGAVGGADPSDVFWIGGDGGYLASMQDGGAPAVSVLHDLRGAVWRGNVLGIWVSSPADAWAVGTGGAMFHLSDAGWSAVPSGTSKDLYQAWVAPDTGDVWVAGESGTILHRAP